MLFSSAMVSNGQKDFSAISESLRQQSITRTAGECSTHYYSGWKIDPAYLELKGSNKYGKVVETARRDRLERCHNCHQEGVLVYCDGACGKGFHAACVNLKVVPAGSWICSGCDQSPGATARRNTLAEQTARTVVHTKQADADAAAFRAVMASSKALVDAARAGFRDIAAAGCFGPARTAVDAARASLDTSLRNCALAFDPLRQDSLMCD